MDWLPEDILDYTEDKFRRSIAKLKGPLLIAWEITNACDMSCQHCALDSSYPLPDELDTDEARRVIDQLQEAGLKQLLFVGGEPLVRPDLLELVRYASQFFTVAINTNAFSLDWTMAVELKEAGVHGEQKRGPVDTNGALLPFRPRHVGGQQRSAPTHRAYSGRLQERQRPGRPRHRVTPSGSLVVSGSSSNSTLVPNANIVFGGSGASATESFLLAVVFSSASIGGIIVQVRRLPLNGGEKNSLTSKLQAAQQAHVRGNRNAAINQGQCLVCCPLTNSCILSHFGYYLCLIHPFHLLV